MSAWERLHEISLGRRSHGGGAGRPDDGDVPPDRHGPDGSGSRLAPPCPTDARGRGDRTVHALVAAVAGYERQFCGDAEASAPLAREAIELGDRWGAGLAAVMGRTATARLRLLEGDVDGGLALLDEVGATLMTGEVDALGTGMMLCEVICAAQGLGRHDLAQEWTDVMDRWRPGVAVGAINGRCRVHRAELLRVTGPADEAEREAMQACEELAPWMRRKYGWPLVELGTIRLRKGDLSGAEEAFKAAYDLAWPAQPGLAMLRLAQGDLEAARSLIDEAVAHPVPLPWKERPPIGEWRWWRCWKPRPRSPPLPATSTPAGLRPTGSWTSRGLAR